MHKCELSCVCPGQDTKLHPHRMKLYHIGLRGIWLGISEGTNVIISKKVIRLDNQLLRLCNRSVFFELYYIDIV